jgi:hypothetical protein
VERGEQKEDSELLQREKAPSFPLDASSKLDSPPVEIIFDPTGLNAWNRGEWMRQKHGEDSLNSTSHHVRESKALDK